MRASVGIGVCLCLLSCAAEDHAASVAAGADALALLDDEAALLAEVTDGIGGMTPEHAAANAAIAGAATFAPAGCATAIADGASVTFVLAACAGTFGAQDVTGTFAVAFSSDATGTLSFHATADGLAIGGATLSMDASGTYASDGGSQTITVLATNGGVGPRGRPVSTVATYTVIRVGATDCRTIDAMWTGAVLTAYRRCGEACPAPGGELALAGADGDVARLEFDGTALPRWTDGTQQGTVTLPCTGRTGVPP